MLTSQQLLGLLTRELNLKGKTEIGVEPSGSDAWASALNPALDS